MNLKRNTNLRSTNCHPITDTTKAYDFANHFLIASTIGRFEYTHQNVHYL